MGSTRTDNIHKSFEKVANIAFDNMPDDISCFMLVYVRDKRTGDNGGDGTIDMRVINKGMMYYDTRSVREYIDNYAFDVQ